MVRNCNRTLLKQLKAASEVVHVEQQRFIECEKSFAKAIRENRGRERSLNTSIAVLEHRLASTQELERERAEALLELSRLGAKAAELEMENKDLHARVNSLKRKEIVMLLKFDAQVQVHERLRRQVAAVGIMATAAALAMTFRYHLRRRRRTRTHTATNNHNKSHENESKSKNKNKNKNKNKKNRKRKNRKKNKG